VQGREVVVDALLALSARPEAQGAPLAALAERVEEFDQRLKRDSLNSSPPPSHDPPWPGKRVGHAGQGGIRAANQEDFVTRRGFGQLLELKE
jgi:Family of unknown function (DUF6444)